MFDFKDKTVLITGAGRGLGKTLAVEFAKAGAQVVATARSEEKLAETKKDLDELSANYLLLEVDVTNYASCESAVSKGIEHFGGIDFLINNASGFLGGWNLTEISLEDIDQEINVTYRAAIYMTRTILKHLLDKRNGTIINIASSAGLVHRSVRANTLYAANKSAVIRFTEAMADQLANHGIRMSAVTPGAIRDKDSDLAAKSACSYEDVAKVVMMQCLDFDNLHMKNVTIGPKRSNA